MEVGEGPGAPQHQGTDWHTHHHGVVQGLAGRCVEVISHGHQEEVVHVDKQNSEVDLG